MAKDLDLDLSELVTYKNLGGINIIYNVWFIDKNQDTKCLTVIADTPRKAIGKCSGRIEDKYKVLDYCLCHTPVVADL